MHFAVWFTVAVASRDATHLRERQRNHGSGFDSRFAMHRIADNRAFPRQYRSAPHSIASQFVDRAARDGPSVAMNRRQTEVGGLFDCHAGVMKSPDRRFWRLHRPMRQMLRR